MKIINTKLLTSEFKTLNMHAIYFDGTSYYVESSDLNTDEDTVMVFIGSNIEYCFNRCDKLNDEL